MKNKVLKYVVIGIIIAAITFVVLFNSLIDSVFSKSKSDFMKPPHEFVFQNRGDDFISNEDTIKSKFNENNENN